MISLRRAWPVSPDFFASFSKCFLLFLSLAVTIAAALGKP